MTEPLRLYEVDLGGHTTRMRLNEADAAIYGAAATPVDDEAGAAQQAKPEPKPPTPPAKGRTPANKARTATDDK